MIVVKKPLPLAMYGFCTNADLVVATFMKLWNDLRSPGNSFCKIIHYVLVSLGFYLLVCFTGICSVLCKRKLLEQY